MTRADGANIQLHYRRVPAVCCCQLHEGSHVLHKGLFFILGQSVWVSGAAKRLVSGIIQAATSKTQWCMLNSERSNTGVVHAFSSGVAHAKECCRHHILHTHVIVTSLLHKLHRGNLILR